MPIFDDVENSGQLVEKGARNMKKVLEKVKDDHERSKRDAHQGCLWIAAAVDNLA